MWRTASNVLNKSRYTESPATRILLQSPPIPFYPHDKPESKSRQITGHAICHVTDQTFRGGGGGVGEAEAGSSGSAPLIHTDHQIGGGIDLLSAPILRIISMLRRGLNRSRGLYLNRAEVLEETQRVQSCTTYEAGTHVVVSIHNKNSTSSSHTRYLFIYLFI